MPEIHDLLERAVADVDPSPDLEARVTAGVADLPATRRHRVLVAAAALVVVVGALAVVAVVRDDDRQGPVVAGPSPTTPTPVGAGAVPPAPSPGDLADATWTSLDPAPLVDGRQDAAWASSDRHLLVWGGSVDGREAPFADGAVLDVRTGRWRTIGPFPGIPGRAAAGAVIDGDAAYVVGGQLSPTVVDGAAATGDRTGQVVRLDLTAGTAEVVADSERAARTDPVVAVADGTLLVSGGRRRDQPDLDTSVLDLAAGTWSEGEQLPWTTVSDPFYWPADGPTVVDGDEVVLARPRADTADLARLDPGTGEVDDPFAVAVAPGLNVNDVDAVATDAGLVVVAETTEAVAVAVDPATGEVLWNEPLGLPQCEGPIDAAGVGDAVVVRTGCGGIVGLDARTGEWSELPAPPGGDLAPSRLVAVGDALLAVDLGSPGGVPNHGEARPSVVAALTTNAVPAAEPETGPVPTSPTDIDGASAGRWEPVAAADLALGRREAAVIATSDRYVLTWGGRIDRSSRPPVADGVLLDLGTGAWRTIPSVTGVAGRWGASAVIDGDVAWVVGGADDSVSTTEADPVGEVVRIDLATGDVEVVATDERAARLEPAVAVHDGQVVVAGGRAQGTEVLGVAALDPVTGAWSDGPDLPWGTASSDYTARLTDTAPAARSGDDLLIARSVRDDDRIDVARLSLADLTVGPPAPFAIDDRPIGVDEVGFVGGPHPMVLFDTEGIQAIGLDGTTERWRTPLGLGSCEGPARGVATERVAQVAVCGTGTFVDPVDGRVAPRPEPPSPLSSDEGSVVAAGDRLLLVDWADDGVAAWVLVGV